MKPFKRFLSMFCVTSLLLVFISILEAIYLYTDNIFFSLLFFFFVLSIIYAFTETD